MKNISILLLLISLLVFNFCHGQNKSDGDEKKRIDYIITNDYMSQRNLSMMGGIIPSGHKKGLIDSLKNCFTERFDEHNNIIEERFYNNIGALYHTNQKYYDRRNRLEKSVEIDEFKNDTCVTTFQHTDSLKLLTHKRVSSSCQKNVLDIYYKYDGKGQKTGEIIYENNALYREKSIQYISKNELQIKSYDKEKRLSTYLYKYNAKDLLIYEKRSEWDSIFRGDYFQKTEENEILYTYDKQGTWRSRITQTYCKPTIKKPKVKVNETAPPRVKEVGVYTGEDCVPEIREKLIRTIYYKQ